MLTKLIADIERASSELNIPKDNPRVGYVVVIEHEGKLWPIIYNNNTGMLRAAGGLLERLAGEPIESRCDACDAAVIVAGDAFRLIRDEMAKAGHGLPPAHGRC